MPRLRTDTNNTATPLTGYASDASFCTAAIPPQSRPNNASAASRYVALRPMVRPFAERCCHGCNVAQEFCWDRNTPQPPCVPRATTVTAGGAVPIDPTAVPIDPTTAAPEPTTSSSPSPSGSGSQASSPSPSVSGAAQSAAGRRVPGMPWHAALLMAAAMVLVCAHA
jgi:hypothetical protein